ncbi:hypothetical protein [Lactovum miscens]|uniref:Uncharacterized protein n=1 Tax=Lactovum miscens TaxID=190387 RepID=A0A841CA42_9LACT|nr:hypothetical protein [Lactovum miscens]MBB5888452.1 hypothetical protein [Lactovum miscens]
MINALKDWTKCFNNKSDMMTALEKSVIKLEKTKKIAPMGHIMNWGGWFEPQDLEAIKLANKSKNSWYIARKKMNPDDILKLLIPARIAQYPIEIQCDGLSDEGDAFFSIIGNVLGIVTEHGIDYLDISGKKIQIDQIRNISIPNEDRLTEAAKQKRSLQ